MKVLYIFPHPDDESFGPASAMHKQASEGNEVFLLTLTKGGATKIRHELGLSIEEMGDVREKEMRNMAQVLALKELKVLDLPDGGLKFLDPRIIEEAVRTEILRIRPEVVVTYAVHGISGFHDHLIIHGIVKRVFCELRDEHDFLRRLCFFTVDRKSAELQKHFKLSFSKDEEIAVRVKARDVDMQKGRDALDCYVTYSGVIENSGIRDQIPQEVCFELFDESYKHDLNCIFEKIKT